ncbi:MAG: basic amino acid/polyamine antiporter [Emergencia sp.]|nr:basic amino acid/polyamine antiporter [Emergencia sp.]
MENKNEQGLGVGKLSLFAIGTTLASGVFSLSGDFAAGGAHTLATLIGWLICGVGMMGLTMCFFKLSVVRTDLTSGIYSYAKEGFGEYVGFNSAWGYWMSALLAQLSFITLLFASLGSFFDVFGDGSNLLSMVVASAIIWILSFLVLRGVNQAVTINAIVVIAKIVPIVVVVVAIILAGAFKMDIFMQNFSGVEGGDSLMEQVKSTVYVTVWLFIGIEGAVVLSGRGKNTKVAGKATVISFVSLFILYFLISFLSMGVMPAEELGVLGNPPMAGVLEYVVGPWGAALVNIAVIISLGGAMFSYTILCVDSAYGPAQQGSFPAVLAKTNKYKAPTWSVIASAVIIQIFIIIIYFNASTYQAVYSLSTSAIMVPYVFSAFYYLKLMIKKQGVEEGGSKAVAWVIAIVGSIYGVWLLYASGLTYILAAVMLYAPGSIMYLYHRKKTGQKYFNNTTDLLIFIGVLIALVVAVYMTATGGIVLL